MVSTESEFAEAVAPFDAPANAVRVMKASDSIKATSTADFDAASPEGAALRRDSETLLRKTPATGRVIQHPLSFMRMRLNCKTDVRQGLMRRERFG
jgi:hypothetical protein